MKRTLCLFLALILAVGICFSAPVTITASAAFTLVSGTKHTVGACYADSITRLKFKITDTENKQVEVYGCHGYPESITIPETVEIPVDDDTSISYAVTAIGKDAFHSCNTVKSLTIPNSVTTIAAGSLDGISSMATVYAPCKWEESQLYELSNLAFRRVFIDDHEYKNGVCENCGYECPSHTYKFAICTNCSYVCHHETVTADRVCETCGGKLCGKTETDKVVWFYDEETTTLAISGEGEMADFFNEAKPWYNNIENITKVVINKGVTTIGDYAFRSCYKLTEIEIPVSVTQIGTDAFKACHKLTTVNVPCSWNENPLYTFEDGVEVVIPKHTIENNNCTVCKGSKCGATESDTVTWVYDEGTLYINGSGAMADYSGSDMPWYNYQNKITKVVINDGVTTIGNFAFRECIELISVTIPDSVKTIDYGAFCECTALESVTIGNSVETIGDNAFYYCTSLASVTIPDSVKTIGEGAFCDCTELKSVTIPDSVTTIGRYAFQGCTLLASVTIGKGVKEIKDDAFYCCNKLATVNVPCNWDGSIHNFAESKLKIAEHNTTKSATCISKAECSVCGEYGDFAPHTYENGKCTVANCNNACAHETMTNGVCVTCRGEHCGKTETDKVVWFYDASDDGNDETLPILTITGTGAMADYTSYDDTPWYNYQNDITKVVIENGVTTIGEFALNYCSFLTSVTIPESVTSIGDFAFAKCTSLEAVTIGEGVTTIGDYAFSDCTFLTTLTIGNKVSIIGDSAFSNCAGLESVTIPDSVTTISGLAFLNCSNLKSVTIPKNVTTIDRYAFAGCAKLISINVDGANTKYSSEDGVLFNKDKTELICYPLGKDATSYTIPDSVTTIGEGAFKGCSKLTSVTIPASVTTIGDNAFYNCPNVLLFVDKNNNYVQNYATANNINYVVDGSGELEKINFAPIRADENNENSEIIAYSVANCDWSISGELKIPATYNGKPVTAIGKSAFENCAKLTSLEIPDSVTTIGDEPFWYAGAIEKITVDDDNKFYSSTDGILFNEDKTELICYPSAKEGESYKIPDTVESISQAAFYACSNLKSIVIPDKVTTINEKTFESCSSLESITIPSSVKSIGNNAFHICEKLESVTIPNDVTSIGFYAFSGCSELKTVTILSETVSIDDPVTFNDCHESLRFFVLDGSKAENSMATDGKCLSFTLNDDDKSYSVTDCGRSISGELEIPDKFNGKPVTEIGNNAFANCTSLASVTIPDSITTIGYSAFNSCTALTLVTIPESVTTIADWAFSSCTELTEIKVAEGNTNYLSVDGILFNAEKTELLCYPAGKKGNYEIPTTVTEIALGAFSGNTSLESVTIPDRVTTIGEGAFMNCTALTSVTIPDSVTTIGRYAFQGCTSLASVTIGDRVKTIDWMTFYDCTALTSVTIGKGVKEINDSAFDCCNKLSTVNAPCDWDTENPLYAFDENVNVEVADHKEIIYVDNNDGTHTEKYSCCGTVIGEPEDHSFDESEYCEFCEYQCPHEKYSNGVCAVCECYCPHTNKEPVYKSYEDNTNRHYKYYECCGMKEWAGYHNDENGDTKCDECEVQLVAKAFLEPWTSQGVRMGDNYFVSLENAVDKVNEIYGEELILLSDATIAEGKTITLESAVFNTNGNKLTVNGILVLSAKKYTGTTIPEGIIGEGTIKIGENTFKFADNEKWSCAEESQHTGSVQTCVGYLCELCGNYYGEANDNHDIVIDEAKAPTCTKTGLTEGQHCTRCDDKTVAQEVVPALNHKGTLVQVEEEAKTCTTVGWEAYEYCTACDYTTYVEIPASHEIVKVNAKAKTCKEAGHNAHEYCTECDYTTKVEIPASHELQEVKAKAPTCEAIGYDAYKYCTECDYTTYKEKAKLGHDIVIDKAVEATCTKTGLTEGSHCTRCNDKTVKQNVIPTKAHTEVIIPKVAPTLTSTGLTEGKKCSVCGTVTVSQQVIAKLVLVAPVITSITSTTGGVKFTWGAVPYAAKYKIYRKTYHPSTGKWDAKWKKINKVEVKGTEYVDSTAKLGTQYMYLVKAVNGKVTKNSAASSIVTFKISPTPTIHLKSNGIKVKWAETVVSAENYRIYRAEYNESTKKYNSYKKVKTVKGTTKSWTDTSVKSGKKYKYCVKAVRGSVVCDKVQTKPIYYLTKPKVTVATATNGIVVNWSAKGASKYRVYRSELQNGVWSGYKEIATPNGKTKTYTDTTAVAGVQYKYKIKAVKSKTGIVSSETKAVTR